MLRGTRASRSENRRLRAFEASSAKGRWSPAASVGPLRPQRSARLTRHKAVGTPLPLVLRRDEGIGALEIPDYILEVPFQALYPRNTISGIIS